MTEQIIISIVSIVISGIIAYLFFKLSKKSAKQQNETMETIQTTAEGIRVELDKLTGKEYERETAPKQRHEPKPSTKDYDKKATKCIELLKDKKWKWRSDVILMRKSGLTQTEFDYFVNNNSEVVRSKMPDIYGNKLFSHTSKFLI